MGNLKCKKQFLLEMEGKWPVYPQYTTKKLCRNSNFSCRVKSHCFGTLLPKTVDFADFKSLFNKKHILLVILFSVEIQEIFDIFFWALLKMVGIRGFGNLLPLKLAYLKKFISQTNDTMFSPNHTLHDGVLDHKFTTRY